MSRHRMVAFLLAALAAGVTGYEFGRPLFAMLAPLVALLGALGRVRVRLDAISPRLFALALGGVIIAQWLASEAVEVTSAILRYGFGYALAQYFVCLQIRQLFGPAGRPLPPEFPAYGAGALICTGDVMADGAARSIFHAASLAFVVLTALFYATAQARLPRPDLRGVSKRRLLAHLMVLAAALSLARGGSWFFNTYEDQLNEAFNRLAATGTVIPSLGFSTKAVLGNMAYIKTRDADGTALRVRAEACPGYLRGMAYDRLEGTRWSYTDMGRSTVSPRKADPAAGTPRLFEIPHQETATSVGRSAGPDDTYTYATDHMTLLLDPREPEPLRLDGHAEITTFIDTAGILFAPLGTPALSAEIARLQVNADGTLDAADGHAPSQYELLGLAAPHPGQPAAPSEAYRRACLGLPGKLDPRIRALAGGLFAGMSTTDQKIGAVVRYFAENYRYTLGIQVPRGKDPLTYFLLERPAAHCEYFASGAAILLRLGGVPCRYVTGFVAADRNPLGGYWNVRNKDAHAWVEAFDEKQGWLTVEATVADGIPTPPPKQLSTTLRHLWDFVKDLMLRIRAGLEPRRLLRAFLAWLAGAGAPRVPVLLGAALAAAGWLLLRRRRSGRRARKREGGPSPELARLQRALRRVDRRVQAAGLTRAPAETLHQFAGRLSAAAEAKTPHAAILRDAAGWYVDYAMLRYAGRLREEDVASLEARRPG